ncbi:GNAT family N-acetyltransferase [Pseudomonas syringae]|uniref:GNAT family N-acetyltransferase n=1 Tax=Pseudomonas syringae TaxID=317 RepID=UPI00224882D7|nr:GNAT family N-acetyltransferase [Pseudomonas syringae]UZS66437.1 GNAT family N-acetyltransferase [Pseudomonas syringae]
MLVRETHEQDWASLKSVRLEALLDAPTAFGVSYETAASYTDERWKELASTESDPRFWMALDGNNPVGMIGASVDKAGRFNLIGMWIRAPFRGSGVAQRLVDSVKAHAFDRGHNRVVLDVSPDNKRAAQFYLRQGFVFIDEFEPLASHPHISVQTMVWLANPQQ